MISWKRVLFLAVVALVFRRSSFFKQLMINYRARSIKINKVICKSKQFDGALEEFKNNFLEGREKGAQIVLAVKGDVVLEAHGGRDSSEVFDDLAIIFSSTKVIESLCVAMLVDRGKLEYDAPIARYWPEFGQHFSETTTVAQLMKHEAGLEEIKKPITCAEATAMFKDIKKLEEYLYTTMKVDDDVRKGERHTRYHAVTRGFYVDVLITRVDGRRAREFIQEEIVAKVPGVEFYLGCPPEAQSRLPEFERAMNMFELLEMILLHKLGIVKLFYHPGPNAPEETIDAHEREFFQEAEVENTLRILQMGRNFRALIFLSDLGKGAHFWANSREFRAMPVLSACGITNARSLALIGAQLASGGGSLISQEGLMEALRAEEPHMDEILNAPVAYTNCGWSLDRLAKGWIGWAGAGGSVYVFSVKHNASLAFIPTLLEGRTSKPNGTRILKAFDRALRQQSA